MAPAAAVLDPPARAAETARANEAKPVPDPLTGGALWAAGVLLALGDFIVLLDTMIANVSVPTNRAEEAADTDAHAPGER